jgi:hypothetical protein
MCPLLAIAHVRDRALLLLLLDTGLPRLPSTDTEIGDRTRLTVEQLVAAAAERLTVPPPVVAVMSS